VHDRPGVTTAIDIAAPPEHVLAWLLHGWSFPLWVVGPGRVVEVDDQWPAPGAGFTHETGRGPLNYRDRTTMQEFDVDSGRVTLEAMVRPFGLALVQVHVKEGSGGSHVVMHERPLGGLGAYVPAPAYAPLLRARNVVAMRRLRRLVEGGPSPQPPAAQT
jgi:hypothetical protein